MTRLVLLLPALLILLPAPASPQELGDAAAKEREKKAKSGATTGKPAPAFSNDDLASEKEKKKKKDEAEARGEEPAPEPGPSQEGQVDAQGRKRLSDPDKAKDRTREATPQDAIPVDATPESADPDEAAAARAAAEAHWRGRLDAARNLVREMEGRFAGIQARIDEMRARISPMNPQQEQDVNRILAVQEEITAAEAELESAQANLKSAREDLVALEETARQAGVPPGWLRPPQ